MNDDQVDARHHHRRSDCRGGAGLDRRRQHGVDVMTLAEPVFMAFVIFSSADECKAFAKYYDLARIFEPQCVEMGGEADYRRPWPDVRPKPRPTQENNDG